MTKRENKENWRPVSSLTLRQPVAWWLLLGYLAAAVVLLIRVLPHPGNRVAGEFADPLGFVWWLEIAFHGVTHGSSILRSSYLNVPVGVSGLWNVSILGLGVPLSPITALFGPVVTYNVVIISGLTLNAWVMALTAARWVSGPGPLPG